MDKAVKQKKAFLNNHTKKNIFIVSMLAFSVIQFLIFWVFVNFDTVLLTFRSFNFNTGKYDWIGFDNYKRIFFDRTNWPLLRKIILNSVLFFPVTNFILLPLSIVAAYILYKKIWGSGFFRVTFFLPSIISIVVLTMAFSFMFDTEFGVMNSIIKGIGLGKIIPEAGWFGDAKTALPMIFLYCIWAGVGMNVVLLSGAISRIPQDIIEYSKIDGIGMWHGLVKIIIPLIWPTISTLFVVGSTAVFTLFLQPMMLTKGGPDNFSNTIGLFVVQQVRAGYFELAATVGLSFSVIGIVIIQLIKLMMDKIGQTVEY